MTIRWILFFVTLLVLSLADFFDDYLNDKTFGVDPGPCPFDDQGCSLNLEADKLPPAIANIEFCITLVLIPVCDTLQNWVKGGLAEVWEVQCSELGVQEIALQEVSSGFDSVSNEFAISDLIQRCTGKARFTDVRLTSLGVDILVSVDAEFETDPKRRGLSVDFVLVLSAEGGFEENLVDLADVDGCNIILELGLSLDNTDFTNLQINLFGDDDGITVTPAIFENQIANILVTIIEGILGGAICGIIEQAGFLNNGDLGVLNVILNEVNEAYDEIAAPVDIDIVETDAEFSSAPETFGSSAQELEAAVLLKDSNLLEFVSTVLNSFLGDPSIQPLRINQAISLLTEPDGFISFDLRDLDVVITLPLSVADAVVTLEEISIDGLNTVEFFSFLANDFSENGDGLNYTLTHDFQLGEFILLTRINLRLKRGSWVTVSDCGTAPNFLPEDECSIDQESFTFDFGLTAKDIDFGLATLTAINFDEIGELQFGQFLDVDLTTNPTNTLLQVLNCLAPSIYAFILSDLKLLIGTLQDPFVDNFSGEGLDTLLENSVDLIFTLIQTVLGKDLINIMRGPIRDFANEVLRANVSDVEDTSLCPPYTQVPTENPYIVFNDGVVEDLFPILTEVLGNFEANSDVDLNDLIQVILDYYSTNAEDFPLESEFFGNWITKASFIPLVRLPAFEFAFPGAAEAFLGLEEVEILNLDSINDFLIASRDAFPNGISYTLGFEEEEDFVFSSTFNFKALGLVDDQFKFSIKLKGISFSTVLDVLLLNMDEFFRLRVEQLEHIPCVLSLIDGIAADATLSNLQAVAIAFNIDFIFPVDPTSPKSDLRAALDILQSEFEDTDSQEQVTRLANYFIGLGYEAALLSLDVDSTDLTPEICDDVESTFGQIFEFFTGFGNLNLTYFVEECLDIIEPISPIEEFEKERLGYLVSEEELGDKYFKNEDNFVLEFLSSVFSEGTEDPETINNILLAFALSSGNPLVDLFVLEEDNITVSLVLPLNEENFILDFFGLEPFIIRDDEGFLIEVESLKIRSINLFIEKFDLFNILSNFTTSYTIEFKNDEAIEVEVTGFLEVNSTEVALEPPGTPSIREVVTFNADLKGLAIYLEVFAAFQRDTFLELGVAHFLSLNENQEFSFTEFSDSCFLQNFGLNGLAIRSFSINIAEISEPTIKSVDNNILSRGVEATIQEMSKIFIDFYVPALPNICENCVRDFINKNIDLQLEAAGISNLCPETVSPVLLSQDNKFYRFSDSLGLAQFQQFLSTVFYVNNFELLNIVLDGLTQEDFFDNNPFDTGIVEFVYNGVSYGSLQFVFRKLRISGLNSFSALRLFEAKDSTAADFDTNFDPYRLAVQLNYTGPTEYQTAFTLIGYDFFVQGPVVQNDIEFDVNLREVGFFLDFLLYFNLNTFMSIQFDQVDSANEVPCIFSPFQGLDVLQLDSTVRGVDIVLDCFGTCDSPVINDLTVGGEFSTSDSELAAELYNEAIEFVVGYLDSTGIEGIFSSGLAQLPDTCADIIDNVQSTISFTVESSNAFDAFVYGTFVIVFGFLVFIVVALYKEAKNRSKIGEEDKENDEDLQKIVLLESTSLLKNPGINICCRYTLPLLSCVCIGMVVVAITASDSLIIVFKAIILGMETNTVDLYPLSMSGIANDSWAGGSYFVSVLLSLGVFIWPIIRNCALVLLWVVPVSSIGFRTRLSLIQLLNLSGKISFVDMFVVAVSLAALKTTVDLSSQEELSFLVEEVFGVDVGISLERGLAIMAVSSFLSLIVSHCMAYYHKNMIDAMRNGYDAINDVTTVPKAARQSMDVMSYKFKSRRVNTFRVKGLIVLNTLGLGLIVLGFFLPLVTFELEGLIGLLVAEIDVEEATKTYSLYEIASTISETGSDTALEEFSLIILLIIFFVITLLAPLLSGIMLNLLVMASLSLESIRTFLYTTILVASWAALDVAFVGVFITLFEVNNIGKIVINLISSNLCFSAEQALDVVVPSQDATCLEIGSSLGIAAVPIVAAIIFQTTALISFILLTLRVIDDRYFYSYVKTGQRTREGLPPKPGCFSRFVLNFLTTSEGISTKQGSEEYTLHTPDENKVDEDNESRGVSTLNPLFQADEEVLQPSIKNPMLTEDKNARGRQRRQVKKKSTHADSNPPSILEIGGSTDGKNKFTLVDES